jgi:septal ring factor EnvC (AmiA/AmiB activator)
MKINTGSVMVSFCFKKKLIFNEKRWTFSVFVLILYALSFFGVSALKAQDRSADSSQGAKMSVKVKLKDAKQFGQLTDLRKELGKAQQDMATLTGKYRGLQKDHQLLRKELIEITKNFQAQNESYRRLQLSIAATIASSKMEAATFREGQLVKTLNDIFDQSRKLALQSVEFCDIVDSLLKQMPIGKIRQAEINLRADELKKGARKLTTLADLKFEQKPVDRCRILAVNKDLQVVVLPVGSVHGVFIGLNYYIGKEVQLRIVTVRPFVSAAVPVKGNIERLAPGMEAVTDAKKVNK